MTMKDSRAFSVKLCRALWFVRAYRLQCSGLALVVGLSFAALGFARSGRAQYPAQDSQEQEAVIRFVRNPDSAPDFKLTSVSGKPLSIASFQGKVVLLNFWATWCGPCRAEIPDLIDLQNRYRGHLQIIGLAVDEDDPEAVKKFAAQFGINYPVAIAPLDLRLKYGGIGALPTSFVINSEGKVVQKHEGLRDPALYETEIRALLGMPIPARVETFEDTGYVFLSHADRASELPGVDFSRLSPEQKRVALHLLNAQICTCGCKFTLAQCRIYDQYCAVSKSRARRIVAGALSASPERPAGTPPSSPSSNPTTQPSAAPSAPSQIDPSQTAPSESGTTQPPTIRSAASFL